jgi:transcriptional regulator with XRE-family HTH domain
MPVHENSQHARRRLRISLRYWRDQRLITQKQVAEALDWSMSKVVRIESGAVRVSMTDLRALLALYKISDEDEVSRLTGLARVARQQPSYQDYPNALNPDFENFLIYESSAVAIETFQSLLIPGLLQTENYARAIMQAAGIVPHEEGVALRLMRQGILAEADAPFLRCIVDEAALRRQVGGPAVMREQLLRLKDADGQRVSVGIIPFTAGAHPSMSESFTILTLESGQEDVLFQEAATRTVTTRENADLVDGYRHRLGLLRAMAVEGEPGRRLIDAALRELTDTAPARRPS